jgi:PAS domain S-box-containing protein
MPTTSLWVWEREIDMMKSAAVSGTDERKTKAQLLAELGEARQRVMALESAEAARQQPDAARQQPDAAHPQLDKALRDSETRYRRLFETAQDGILLLDAATGRITDVNPFLEKMLGYSHAEIVDQYLWEIGPFKDVAESKLAFEQLQTNEYIRYEDLPLEARDGRRVQVEFISNVYRINGGKVIQCNVRDITAHYQTEKALRASEERYRSLMEQASDGIFVADASGQYIDVNSMGCALLGYSREEILQKSMKDLVNPDELAANPFKLTDMQAGQAVLNERHMLRKDGSLLPTEISGRQLPDGRMLGIVRDITARKQAEQEIKNLARFPAENPNPVLRVGADGVLLYANQASAVILQEWDCAVGERVPAFWQAVVAAAFTEQSNQHLDVPLADRVWSFFLTPVSEAGYINLYGRDITDRRRVEQALFESRAILQAALDQNPAGIAIADAPDGKLRYVNDAGLLIRGGDRQSIVDGVGIEQYVASWQILDLDGTPLQPDQVPLARAVLYGETNRREFIVRRTRNDDRIVLGNAAPILNEAGQVVAGIVVFTDITERKQAEEALRESEDKFKYVFEHSVIGKSITRPSGEIQVNQAFCQMLGYSAAELQNKTWQEISHPDDVDLTQRDVDALLRGDKKAARFIKRYLHKNGSVVWADVNTSLRRDQAGQPLYFMTAVMTSPTASGRNPKGRLRSMRSATANAVCKISSTIRPTRFTCSTCKRIRAASSTALNFWVTANVSWKPTIPSCSRSTRTIGRWWPMNGNN